MPPSLRILIRLWLLALGCAAEPPATPAGWKTDVLRRIDSVIEQAVTEHRCPGAVIWIEREGRAYHRAYGARALEPEHEAATEDTIYDAASLTKVLATTPAVMLLVEEGRVEIDAPASRYLKEFRGTGKEAITVRQLLTHTSGLRAGLGPFPEGEGHALAAACAEPLPDRPGTLFRYSDINFILLGEIVRRVSGEPLERFCATRLYEPLAMTDTRFRLQAEDRLRIAPTEWIGATMLRGVVHDPTSRRMGGVAGHAGLFTTAADVARYARLLLGGGTSDGVKIFSPATVKLMTTVQSPAAISAKRGLGWDIDSPYSGPRGDHFSTGSYGHTGWTGGSLWVDPTSETFVIFLTNRNHPNGSGNVIRLWHTLGTLAAEATNAGG